MANQADTNLLSELKAELDSKGAKLMRAEEELIKLTKCCANLMNKDLKAGADSDSWSLGSAGSVLESDSVEIRSLKEKIIKLKQNEEYLQIQVEVLQSTVHIMVHPDDIEEREKKDKAEAAELKLQLEELLATNMGMKLDLSEVDDLKSEIGKLKDSGEKKTSLIEELHEKLAKCEEHNSALLESLQQTENAEQTLRDSLTRIRSSENITGQVMADDDVQRLEDSKQQLLQRVDSLEEKDSRLRSRLQQVEEHEQSQEAELDKLKDEVQLTKDINASQEQTIVDLQQQLMDAESSDAKQKSNSKMQELEKKCSNMKLLLSQKMEELAFSRKSISSLEKSVDDLKVTAKEIEVLRERAKDLHEELTLTKDINLSQEETIRQLQMQDTDSQDLAQSYHEQLSKQLSAEDVEEMQTEHQREIAQLRNEIDTLNKMSDEHSSKHQQELSSSQKKISSIEQELTKLVSKAQIAQNVIDELKAQNRKLTHEHRADYDDKLKDLNMKLQGEKVQNSVHRDVIASMSPQLEKLICENESYEANLNSLKDKLSMTESDLAKKKSEADSMRSRVNCLEKKLDESKEIINSLQASQISKADHAVVKQNLEAKTAESDNLAVDLIEMTDKCAEFEKQLHGLTSELDLSNEERNKLESSCDSYRKQLADVKTTGEQAEEIQAAINSKTAECQKLHEELSVAKTETADLNVKLANMEAEFQEELCGSKANSNALENANQQLADHVKLKEKLKCQLQEMTSERERQLDMLRKVEAENDNLQRCLDSKVKECQDLSANLQESQQQLGSLKAERVNDMEMYRSELDGLYFRIKSLESDNNKKSQDSETLAELQALVIAAAKDMKEMEAENLALVDNLKQAHSKISLLDSENKSRQDELDKLGTEMSRQQSLTTSLKAQIANLDDELRQSSQSNEKTVDSLKRHVYSLTQDNSALQIRNDKLVIEVDKILSEKQIYFDEIEKLASQLKVCEANASKNAGELRASVDDLNQRLEEQTDANRDLCLQSETQSQLKVEDLLKENNRYQTELDSISLTLSEVTQERDALLAKCDNGEPNQTDIHSQYKKLRQEFDMQQIRMVDLTNMSENTRNAKEKLETHLSDLQSENMTLSKQVRQCNVDLDDLKQKAEEERNKSIYLSNKQSDKYNLEVKTLQEALADLQAERDDQKRQVASMKNFNDHSTQIPDLKAQVKRLEADNDMLTQEFEILQLDHLDQLSSSSAETSILQAQLNNMSEVVKQFNKDRELKENLQALSSELQNRLKDEKKAHSTTATELNAIKVERMSFKEQVEDLKEKREHSQQQCEELESEIKLAESLAAHHQEQMEMKKAENEQLTNQLESDLQHFAGENSELQSKLDKMQLSLDTHKTSHNEMLKLNEDLANQLKIEKSKTETLSDKFAPLQVELSDLQSNGTESLETLRSQLEDQKAVCGLAKAAVALSVQTDNEDGTDVLTAENDQDDYIEALQSEIKLLSDELSFTKNENDDLSGRVSDLYEQVSEQSKNSRDLETLRDQHTDLAEEHDQHKEMLLTYTKRIDELTNLLNTMESRKQSLEDTLESMQANNPSISGSEQELEGKVTTLEAQINNQERVVSLLKSEKEQLVSEIHALRSKSVDVENVHIPDELKNLRVLVCDKDEKISDLEAMLDVMKSSYATENLSSEDRIRELTAQLNEKVEARAELETKIEVLQQEASTPNADVDYKSQCELAQNQIEGLEYECKSLEVKLQKTTTSNIELSSQISALKVERDRLATQVRASPRMDESNTDGVEYRGLQRQVIELKQKLQSQTKLNASLESDKTNYEQKLETEKETTEEAMAQVEKLQTSISILMSSHETEMSSLQTALQDAMTKMESLELEVSNSSTNHDKLNSLVTVINAELRDIKTSKDAAVDLLKDLIVNNKSASTQFSHQLCRLLGQIEVRATTGEGIGDLSTSLPSDHYGLIDDQKAPSLSSSMTAPVMQPESLATVSHYGQLSKADLVAKLSDQTKHELILRKHLSEARQSLAFYRSAIDNIIACLGTAMPGVKKWATDFMNTEDQVFSQHLDALISNESALQRRCHALEMSEKALTESFETKEREYQSAIQRLEDMVAVLKSSKAKLAEELKLKSMKAGLDTEQQLAELNEKVYELEGAVRKLRLQNEELQFAYEQECERRQVQEEERCKADQRSRLNTVEAVRESEYLSKIASLESKISNLLRTQNQLEGTIDSLKHDSREEELKIRVETLERSERALLRKIEILQQTDSRGTSSQFESILDRPEDLLKQKIWEMEKMEIHLKQQVSDLEHDREELHEIARSDKNTIHELNIQLAESSLANKNLKAQVSRIEQIEEITYTKLENAESRVGELEQKLREALESEKTMRYQLEDVEYSEDTLRFRTGNMEKSLDTLQDNETVLKKTIDDLTNEKQQALKETASCKSRLKEMEGEQALLRSQILEIENREITLKGRISQLAAIEAALQTRNREVELENKRLTSKILHLEQSATTMRDSFADSVMGKEELNSQLQGYKSAEKQAKARVADMETEIFESEKKLQDVNFKYIQLQSQLSKDETVDMRMGERLAAALSNEKQARAQAVRLEAVVAAYESKQTSGIVERENFQLNADNKNVKDKLKTKERDLRDMEEKVNRLTSAGNSGGGTYRINRLQTEIKDLQTQLRICEQSRASLEEAMQKVKAGKKTCGYDVEIARLKAELARVNESGLSSSHQVHGYPDANRRRVNTQITSSPPAKTRSSEMAKPQQSLRTQCLKELMTKVNQRKQSDDRQPAAGDDDMPLPRTSAVEQGDENPPRKHSEDAAGVSSDDEAADIASQSSIWEKLEPPIRRSPITTMCAKLKPDSPPPVPARPPSPPESLPSEVPEESSLWENLELYEPRKSSIKPVRKVEIVFDEAPIAPASGPGKGIDVQSIASADEVPDLAEQESPEKSGETVLAYTLETTKQSPPFSVLSAQAGLMDSKDLARLKQNVIDLERQLKSRETEIRMLRNGQKEIERESSLSGDMYTLKTKLKALQAQVDSGEKKIKSLREEIMARDKNLINRQKEIVELRVEMRKLRESQPVDAKQSVTSPALSPAGRQRQLQNASIAKLERELTDVKIAAPSPTDSNTAKFKYLDDRYTEAATKCYNMKQERDELKNKFDELASEHAKCQQQEHAQCQQQDAIKCQKCKVLKREIRRLQKELYMCTNKLVEKVVGPGVISQQRDRARTTDSEDTSTITATHSGTIDDISSLSEDTVNHRASHNPQSAISASNGNARSPTSKRHRPSTDLRTNGSMQPFQSRYYDAVADYNPQYFSTSGRLAQEVALQQGQRVKVLEQADDTGYCRAEVNGRIHLVPMKYLQLVDSDRQASQHTVRQHTVRQLPARSQSSIPADHSPLQGDTRHSRSMTTYPSPSAAHYDPESRRTKSLSPMRRSAPVQLPQRSIIVQPRDCMVGSDLSIRHAAGEPLLPRKPRAPTDLSIEVVANQKIYIEWTYVQYLDHKARSNGTAITGFRVFLNGRSVKDVNSPYTTVTQVDTSREQLVDLHTVSVQAMGAANVNSSLTHHTVSHHLDNSTSTTTSSAMRKPDQYSKSDKKRLFMAYYDYDPRKQGPYSRGYKATCDDELSLTTGDFVVVYGEPRPNGFYMAEVNGRRGYAPEAFIRQVPAENAKRYGFHNNDAYLPQ